MTGTETSCIDASSCSATCQLIHRAFQSRILLLETELAQLKDRYDALLQSKEAAAARYLSDYKKWMEFKQWLFKKNKRDLKARAALSSPERKRQNLKDIQQNCKKFREEGPCLDDAEESRRRLLGMDANTHGGSNSSRNKENLPTPSISNPDEPFKSPAPKPQTKAQTQVIPAKDGLSAKEAELRETKAKPGLKPDRSSKTRNVPIQASSDTEEESQPFLVPFKPPPMLTPFSPSVTAVPQACARDSPANGNPRKIRKVSEDHNEQEETDKVKQSSSTASGVGGETRQLEPERQKIADNVPESARGQKGGPDKQIRGEDDYSKFKGRGRYNKDKQRDSGTTINAQFQIDKTKNNGVEFQFNEVVRDRQARKDLHGGDCECCRDYYEAIGDLPPLPGPPLWQSPDPNEEASIDPDNQRQTDIAHHKQRISRHRHHWSPPRTPPGYWTIGFPNTQEVAAINMRASEMHRRKMVGIKVEAGKSNGRYKKR